MIEKKKSPQKITLFIRIVCNNINPDFCVVAYNHSAKYCSIYSSTITEYEIDREIHHYYSKMQVPVEQITIFSSNY